MGAAEGYRYTLEPYHTPASRYTCPACGHRRRFTRYIDTATGEHVAEHVGRCDRQDKCGHHLKPREYFAARGEQPAEGWTPPPPPPELPGYRMSREAVRSTMGQECGLLAYLGSLPGIDPERVNRTAWEYCVGGWPVEGTYHHAATFWQVDHTGQVRGAKVVPYDPGTGHRLKFATWAHALNGGIPEGFRLEQCLFGEHLLDKYPTAPVGIVEAEKTALVARLFVPEMLWLAVGGLTELKLSKLLPLAGREVTLWPDLGKGFTLWSMKTPELDPLFGSLKVVDLLEQVATEEEREHGLDLADYLLSRTEAEVPAVEEPEGTTIAPATSHPIARMVQGFIQRHKLEHFAELMDLDLSRALLSNHSPVRP